MLRSQGSSALQTMLPSFLFIYFKNFIYFFPSATSIGRDSLMQETSFAVAMMFYISADVQ